MRPGGPADGVDQHQRSDLFRVVVGKLDGDPTTKGVPYDEWGWAFSKRPPEPRRPVAVPGQAGDFAWERLSSHEPRQRRSQHVCPGSHEAREGPFVCLVVQSPTVQEEHRRSSTCLAVTSRPTIDLGTLPRQPARIPPRFDLDNGCDAGNLLDWIHSSTMVRSAMAGRGSKGIRAADFRPFSHESHGRTGRRSNRNPSAAPNVWIVRRGARSCITQPRSSTVVFDAEREAPADSLLARSGM